MGSEAINIERVPKFDPTTSWLWLEDETEAEETLLGGSEEAAAASGWACRELGLSVRPEDMLHRQTLSDLEYRVPVSRNRWQQLSLEQEPVPRIARLGSAAGSEGQQQKRISDCRGSSWSSASPRVQLANEVLQAPATDVEHVGKVLSVGLDRFGVNHGYWGPDNAPNTYDDVAEAGFALSADQTRLLNTSCNQPLGTESADIYLAALTLSFAQTFQDRQVPVVWNREHGMGSFKALCPAVQAIVPTVDFMHVLRRLKDTRRSMTAHGLHGPHCFPSGLGMHECPIEVMFSYEHSEKAMSDPMLALRAVKAGPGVGRIALFEISATIDQGSAKVKVSYNRHAKDPARIAEWMDRFEQQLVKAIGQLRHHPQELTLADVPHLDVTYHGLDVFNKQRLTALGLMSVRDIDAVYPVTAVEQVMLVSQSQHAQTCYLHAIYEFASPYGDAIDAARICTAWQHVTLRHAALRTVFTESVRENGLYDKVVLRRTSPDMLFLDAASGPDAVDQLTKLPNLPSTDSKPKHRLTVLKAPARTLVKLDISTALCDVVHPIPMLCAPWLTRSSGAYSPSAYTCSWPTCAAPTSRTRPCPKSCTSRLRHTSNTSSMREGRRRLRSGQGSWNVCGPV